MMETASAVGYQPTLAAEMGALQERITSTKKGSITSFQAVYVPADDLTDPAPATTFAHLDATIVLERAIAELGIYPAVDPLVSTSRWNRPSGFSALGRGRGRTNRVVGFWANEFTHVPIPMATSKRKKVDPEGRDWNSVLTATGQPKEMR